VGGAAPHPGELRNRPETVDRPEDHPVDRPGGGFDLAEHRFELLRLDAPAVGLEVVDRLAVDMVESGMRTVVFEKTGHPLGHHLRLLRDRPFAEGHFVHEKDRELFFGGDVEDALHHVAVLFLDEVEPLAVVGVEHHRDGVEPRRLHAADLPADDLRIRRIVKPHHRIAVAVPVEPPRFAVAGQRGIHVRERLLAVGVGEPPPDVPLLDVGGLVFENAEALFAELRPGGGRQQRCRRAEHGQQFRQSIHFLLSPGERNRCGMPGFPVAS